MNPVSNLTLQNQVSGHLISVSGTMRQMLFSHSVSEWAGSWASRWADFLYAWVSRASCEIFLDSPCENFHSLNTVTNHLYDAYLRVLASDQCSSCSTSCICTLLVLVCIQPLLIMNKWLLNIAQTDSIPRFQCCQKGWVTRRKKVASSSTRARIAANWSVHYFVPSMCSWIGAPSLFPSWITISNHKFVCQRILLKCFCIPLYISYYSMKILILQIQWTVIIVYSWHSCSCIFKV